MRRGLALVLLVVWGHQAHATGIPVFDAAVATETGWTAIQTTIGTAHAILHTGYMMQDLLGITELAVDTGTFAADMAELAGILQEGGQVVWDIKHVQYQVEALFGLRQAPNGTRALNARQAAIRQQMYEVYWYAMRVQALTASIVHTVEHIKHLLARIKGFAGQKQALQNVSESLEGLKQLQARQAVATAAMQRAQTMQAMEGPMVQESLQRINDAILVDMPK